MIAIVRAETGHELVSTRRLLRTWAYDELIIDTSKRQLALLIHYSKLIAIREHKINGYKTFCYFLRFF